MRQIQKNDTPPQYLTDWICRQQSVGHGIKYKNFDYTTRLRRDLMKEQYYLCAYTGERLDDSNSHIEHLKPRSECKREVENQGRSYGDISGDDLDYHNMVAALTVEGSPQYGADEKGDWHVPSLFVSPLHSDCEESFRFNTEGKIMRHPQAPRPEAVQKTIEQLRLDDANLTEDREGTILGLIFKEDADELLPTPILELIYRGLKQPDDDGKLNRFSFVVVSVLEDVLK